MELLHNLIFGFSVALSWQNLFYCFVGCLMGTMVGVLPGLGPMATMAMLLPLTFSIPATAALIMLAGIYYGAMYGGSTTSILVNLPGEVASVVTCIDGHQMARQGRAGSALAISAIGSFFAGTVCTLIIAVLGPPIAAVALQFSSPEYFSLMLLALVSSAVLSQGNMLKSLAMISVGLVLGMVGTDVDSGVKRFTFGLYELSDGINFVVIAVGIFAVREIISNLSGEEGGQVFTAKLGHLYPTREEFKKSIMPIIRGTALGAVIGVLPGAGAALASFSSYIMEKKLAKDPSRFGHGAIEGVAGPESANNADAQCKFIPMLTLGIPASATMAMVLAALIMQGIVPGPQVMTQKPDLFWGLIASMWVGNLILIILNLPLVGLWVSLLKIPYRLLFPSIMVFCAVGVYSTNNISFDIYLVILFGILGVLWQILEFSSIPLLLGCVLGPMLEENLRRSLQVSDGSFMIFLTRPISLTFVLITIAVLVIMLLPKVHKRRGDITE